MKSKLRQIRERKLAEAAIANAPMPIAATPARRDPAQAAADLKLVQLTEDLKRLKTIESIEKKIDLKRELLPAYTDWVFGLAAHPDRLPQGEKNDVLTNILMWAIDTGAWETALPLADVVVTRRIPLPLRFDRSAPCAIAEEIAEAALVALRDGKAFDADIVDTVQDLVAEEDMPDEVRAKLYKAEAQLSARRAAELEGEGGVSADGVAGAYRMFLESARAAAQRALELDSNCGAKTLRRDLDRKIEKLLPKTERETEPAADTGS
ncbi:phage terminase small subunit [Novosphingopyxis sp. YJ-S2-01]|uniref:phage terminase small subunit n=1 Tax=Novosphingopyxis sp. YJ-S2-01 TaxID=2794021 RepID=UPI0018DBC11E|nr:phage terminase small subunit [Novosphingopyxis sp. YJ-S2-01]MBH9537884.1 hypothetical protein [Novosphingopyxis sp. YJ-S2-01]